MEDILIEVICQSVEDCIKAEEVGADRIELLSALSLGGISPSLSTLIEAKKQVEIPIVVMLRPRAGGYAYSEFEKKVMLADAVLYLEHGADGIVFGALSEGGKVDTVFSQKLITICSSYNKEAIFSRAVDVTNDFQEVEKLVDLGIHRILTSGFNKTAVDGKLNIAEMIERFGQQVEILPGSGISPDNVLEIMEATNADQIHISGRDWTVDPTNQLNPNSPMGYDTEQKEKYEVFSKEKYKEINKIV